MTTPDEAQALFPVTPDFSRATPKGHRPCRHCDGNDDHCSVCEGVGYLPDTAARKDTP